MQFEGFTGEVSGDHYERVVDVNFPDLDNCFFWVGEERGGER